MQTVETLNEGLKRAFRITIAATDIDARVDLELKKVAPQVRMPGFRPGKVPANLIRKMHGASLQAQAIQGIRSQLDRFYLSGRSPTLRELATRKVSLDSMPFIGTPQRVADSLACTIEAVGGDGFAIRQGLWPGYVGPFVEQVVPLLQQRGVARAEYAGTTLREHLREF